MDKNNWRGFDNWMCFRCGKKFTLDKYVGYDHNTLMLTFSDCGHPGCSYCNNCYTWILGPLGVTDFQQFNLLRLDYQFMSVVQELGNLIVEASDSVCNKCFIFNLLVCFCRAKIFKHGFDMAGAAANLTIGAFCTVQGLLDNVGHWPREKFISLAEKLDDANDGTAAARIIKLYLG